MLTPTAEEETYCLTPAGLAVLDTYAPSMTQDTQHDTGHTT